MAGITSIENGKKGGRPKGSKATHTLAAETLRAYLIERVIKENKPIINALISKAKKGDLPAIKEILERTLGRPTEKVKQEFEVDFRAIADKYR